MKEYKKDIFLIIIGVIYGGLFGCVMCPFLNHPIQSLSPIKFLYFFMFGSVGGVLVITHLMEGNLIKNIGKTIGTFLTFILCALLVFRLVSLLGLYEFSALTQVLFPMLCWCSVLGWIPIQVLKVIAKLQNTNPEFILNGHIVWVFSLLNRFTCLLFKNPSVDKSVNASNVNKRTWDIDFIIVLTQELTEVFPEDWNDWQHWISDMMDSRTRMQSKGMNHRLVSLITFYRLTRFAMHIGIDKVFILATRRATR